MNYLKLKKSGNTESNTCASTSSSVKTEKDEDEGARQKRKEIIIELGNESQVLYNPRLIGYDESWDWFHYFDSNIPWTRPTIRVFGRSCIQVFRARMGALSLSVSVVPFGIPYFFWRFWGMAQHFLVELELLIR